MNYLPYLASLLGLIPLVLWWSEHKQRKQLEDTIQKLQKDAQPKAPEWATQESLSLIHDATKKADAIVTEAEMESLKMAASSDLNTRLIRTQLQAFEAEYQKKFEANMNAVQQNFLAYLGKTEAEYKQFLVALENRGNQMSTEVENAAKAKINEVFFNFEQNLTNFLSQSQQQSLDAVQLEIKSARQLIDTYRQEQLKIIDENIVAVLERTLSIVLRNKLSLKEQVDLVFESLEKAKSEKFFG